MIKDDESKIATLKSRKSEENSEKLAFFRNADQDGDARRCAVGISGLPQQTTKAQRETDRTAVDRHVGNGLRLLAMSAMRLAGVCDSRDSAAQNRSFNARTGGPRPAGNSK